FPNVPSVGGEEASVKLNLDVDFSWMERAFGIGFRNDFELSQSLIGSAWQGFSNDNILFLRPWQHLSVQVGTLLVQRYGAWPSWETPDLFGVEGLRGATDPGLSPASGFLMASVDMRLTDLIVL